MDISDISFHCIDEASDNEADEELNADYYRRTARVNDCGKKVRGRDLIWNQKIKYLNAKEFEESQVWQEIKDDFTIKRKHSLEYGDTEHYVCKFARKKRYTPCPYELKIIYPSDSFEVIIQETGGNHLHKLDPDFLDSTKVFRWTRAATDVVIDGLRVGSVPKVIMRSLRDHGCFADGVEPTQTQLYNKVKGLLKQV